MKLNPFIGHAKIRVIRFGEDEAKNTTAVWLSGAEVVEFDVHLQGAVLQPVGHLDRVGKGKLRHPVGLAVNLTFPVGFCCFCIRLCARPGSSMNLGAPSLRFFLAQGWDAHQFD